MNQTPSRLVAAIDQGTTSTRCILFDENANLIANSQLPHEQILPKPGWVEHDPLEILANVHTTLRDAIRSAGGDAVEIVSLGITNQRETTVVWNRETGQPYTNAIVWQDTRTDKLCEVLSRRLGGIDRFREKTGLPISVYFSGIKLRWLFDEMPELRDEAAAGRLLFGTIDTWLIWNLTGGINGGLHITDVTNASRTMLMNLATLDWDDGILSELDLPRSVLPEIHPSVDAFGIATIDGREIPIGSVLGDQQAALFGQTCFKPGQLKNTYGTGCFLLMNTGETAVRSNHGLITTVAYQLAGQRPVYCLEGSVAIAGSLVQWLRDNMKMISSSNEIESAAREVTDNGDVYIVPAFSGLFAPYWRADARGIIAGLTRFSNRGHLARAVLESVAFQTLDVVQAMEKDTGAPVEGFRVDGGMTVNELLMQFQSDILDIPIVTPTIRETTAMGAAFAAGLTAGYWKSLDELTDLLHEGRSWQPQMDPYQRNTLIAKWRKAVSRSFGWLDEAE